MPPIDVLAQEWSWPQHPVVRWRFCRMNSGIIECRRHAVMQRRVVTEIASVCGEPSGLVHIHGRVQIRNCAV